MPAVHGWGAPISSSMEDATIEDTTIARTIHVIAVVLWIGGVGFVTTVLLPAVRRMKSPAERLAFFDGIERRFAWQARMTTLLAGLSGLYILIRREPKSSPRTRSVPSSGSIGWFSP
jgi:putative copper export protein